MSQCLGYFPPVTLSLIFEALPYFDNSTIMVISPFNSIIEEQVRRNGEPATFSDSVIKQTASVSTYKDAENDNVVVPGDILSKVVRCANSYIIGHQEKISYKDSF